VTKIHEIAATLIRAAARTVRQGVKPVASVTIRADMLYKDSIDPPDDISCLVFPRGETHRELYIFKHAHLAEVIRASEAHPHDEAVVQAWFNGKMFGYSEDSIAEYIEDMQR
jgi:hypothetical protein